MPPLQSGMAFSPVAKRQLRVTLPFVLNHLTLGGHLMGIT